MFTEDGSPEVIEVSPSLQRFFAPLPEQGGDGQQKVLPGHWIRGLRVPQCVSLGRRQV
jgi:hypothetical protein